MINFKAMYPTFSDFEKLKTTIVNDYDYINNSREFDIRKQYVLYGGDPIIINNTIKKDYENDAKKSNQLSKTTSSKFILKFIIIITLFILLIVVVLSLTQSINLQQQQNT